MVSNTSKQIAPAWIRKLDIKYIVICTEKRHKIRISLVKACLPILDFQVEDSYCKIVVVNAFLRLRFHAIMVVVYGVMKRPKSESQPCMIDFSKKILKIIMKSTNYFANILNHFQQNDYLSFQVVTIAFHHVYTHGLRTPREEIAFTARPKIQSQSRDIHIECSKQFKWNSYFYVSGQSWPFWAALKLL